ncbi:MAG: hypothetical protein ACLUE1_00190 [Adlercreutzia equolifaciens]
MRRTFSTYGAKMRQANREAVATVIALAVIVAVWLVGGIGLAGCGIEVFSTPLWIIGGTRSWVSRCQPWCSRAASRGFQPRR